MITNNEEIKKYDFYNPRNIFVIDENCIEIPLEFFMTDYEPVPMEIYDKYSLKTWVSKVLYE